MDFLVQDFRNAQVILRQRQAWASLERALWSIDATMILNAHARLEEDRKRKGKDAPAGGQTAVNDVFELLLHPADGWRTQVSLFRAKELEKWTIDFLRDRIGVEVSFNHAEAIPWQFTRLNIAGESERVVEDARIDVGVVICASRAFKRWARMDSAVGTFDQFKAWLREMRPILPIPMLLVGLDAPDWDKTDVFRGTRKGTRTTVNHESSEGPTLFAAPLRESV
jgi:hypothetical protein